jgi:peptide/nickel transport system permease protein
MEELKQNFMLHTENNEIQDKEAQNTELIRMRSMLKKQERELFFRRIFSNRFIVTGGTITLLLVIVAIFARYIAQTDPYSMVVSDRLQGPSLTHWFGTDNFGRDLFSRVVNGTQISLFVGFAVALISTVVGMILGLYASYYRYLDNLIMRICDGLMSFPGMLLAISLMAVLGAKTSNVLIALSIGYFPTVARIVRSVALVVREQTYIEAMKCMGAGSQRIIWRHIAPNVISPLIVQASYIFATAIIVEAGLSFLGVGVPAPTPSWGNIISDGKLFIFKAWWMIAFPGVMLILAVLGLNLLGDGLRDLLDPHRTQSKK